MSKQRPHEASACCVCGKIQEPEERLGREESADGFAAEEAIRKAVAHAARREEVGRQKR